MEPSVTTQKTFFSRIGVSRRAGRALLLVGAFGLTAAIALADWTNAENIPLGFFYLLPMLMLGRVLKAWQIVVAAVVCTLLAELYDPFAWNLRVGLPRDNLYFAAFVTVGLFVFTANRNRLTVLRQMEEIERQRSARQEAEEQLKALIETSPAAILTADAEGWVLMANGAAGRLLGLEAEELAGTNLVRFFPSLARVARGTGRGQLFRTVMQSRGSRADGETFMAEICFSTYGTATGARLTAMVLDTSEELRTQEETSLQQMLTGSRIAVSAISHEVRNVCGAISVVHQNLARSSHLAENKDFEALGSLVLALEQIAAVDLLEYPDERAEVDVSSVLDDLKIVIAPTVEDDSIQVEWQIEEALPAVLADRTKLMQIFLNLTSNSLRALGQLLNGAPRTLRISARASLGEVLVEFLDYGGGVAHPEELFHPFQAGAHATGLGLYLSRAFARSFGGDLHYTPLVGCACFTVHLPVVANGDGV
jgi:PAS domain S-box-containing protein